MSIADDLFESVTTAATAHGFRVARRHGEKHGSHWTWVFILTDESKEPAPPTLGISVAERIETAEKVK